MDINKEFERQAALIKSELSLTEQNHKLLISIDESLKVINERQRLENNNGKKWTAITVLIMVCAFYVEIVKIDDISILKNRAIDFIHSATDTYKVKVD